MIKHCSFGLPIYSGACVLKKLTQLRQKISAYKTLLQSILFFLRQRGVHATLIESKTRLKERFFSQENTQQKTIFPIYYTQHSAFSRITLVAESFEAATIKDKLAPAILLAAVLAKHQNKVLRFVSLEKPINTRILADFFAFYHFKCPWDVQFEYCPPTRAQAIEVYPDEYFISSSHTTGDTVCKSIPEQRIIHLLQDPWWLILKPLVSPKHKKATTHALA